jgi:hypothetical protein
MGAIGAYALLQLVGAALRASLGNPALRQIGQADLADTEELLQIGGGDLSVHAVSLSQATSASRSFEQRKQKRNCCNYASGRSYRREDKDETSEPSIRRAISLSQGALGFEFSVEVKVAWRDAALKPGSAPLR